MPFWYPKSCEIDSEMIKILMIRKKQQPKKPPSLNPMCKIASKIWCKQLFSSTFGFVAKVQIL